MSSLASPMIPQAKVKMLCAAGLIVTITTIGCNTARDPLASSKIGQRCSVQFRRDALGAAAASPIPPETDAMNGAEVVIVGTLKRVQDDAVLIDTDRFEYIIPMHAILSLRFELPPAANSATAQGTRTGP